MFLLLQLIGDWYRENMATVMYKNDSFSNTEKVNVI